MQANNWMSWEGGFDLVAASKPNLPMPDVIVHAARLVHTPLGSTPAGMVLIPGTGPQPALIGFIAGDESIGRSFGHAIFAGTPFEHAPVHRATIRITAPTPAGACSAHIRVANHTIEATLEDLGPAQLIDRAPAPPAVPFAQRVVERIARKATLSFDSRPISLTIPPVGISGGPAAVWAATGIYAR